MTSKHFLHQTYIFASPPLPISFNILALEDHRQNSCFQLRFSSCLPLEWYNLPHFMKIRKNQQCRAHSCRDRVCVLAAPHVWGQAKRWRNTFQWQFGSIHKHHVLEKSLGTQKASVQYYTWRKCIFLPNKLALLIVREGKSRVRAVGFSISCVSPVLMSRWQKSILN